MNELNTKTLASSQCQRGFLEILLTFSEVWYPFQNLPGHPVGSINNKPDDIMATFFLKKVIANLQGQLFYAIKRAMQKSFFLKHRTILCSFQGSRETFMKRSIEIRGSI